MRAPKYRVGPFWGREIPHRCGVCGGTIPEGTECEASRLKSGGTVYTHTDCIKYRKERKK